METVPKLQEGEFEQFSFPVGQCGPGLCQDSAEGFRKWIPFLSQHPDVEYRVAVNDHRCVVLVRPNDALESLKEERAEAQKKALKHFRQCLPSNIIVSVLLGIVMGGAFTVAALVLSSIFGLKPNLLYAFVWGFGLTAIFRSLLIAVLFAAAKTVRG